MAGAIFTLPALYILKLDPHPVQTIFICLAGGCLGVLFLIPLRRYFVREMHGQFPFPEATAITEVLVTGEKGGSQARLLLRGHGHRRASTTSSSPPFTSGRSISISSSFRSCELLAERAPHGLQLRRHRLHPRPGLRDGPAQLHDLSAPAASLANFVLVPLIWLIGQPRQTCPSIPASRPSPQMTAAQISASYVRYIGVGAIATAGIFGVLKSLRIIAGSFGVALRAFRRGEAAYRASAPTATSPVIAILLGVVVSALGVGDLLLGSLQLFAGRHRHRGLALTLLFAFFFTSVAANAIATTARNPVSGMTMLTIIISSVVLLRFGLSGTTGMFFVMAIAGMVCTALSRLRPGHHRLQDRLLAGLHAGRAGEGQVPGRHRRGSVAVGLTIVMLAQRLPVRRGRAGRPARRCWPSPQASIMKALVEGFMSRQPVAYLLFGAGAAIAVVMEMLGKSRR